MFSHTVANARPRPVDDRSLSILAKTAHEAAAGICDAAKAEWLLSCAGPLLDELIQRRAAMAELPVMVDTSNVVTLPGVR